MKKLFYPLTLALTLLATSCTNNQDDMTTPTDPSGKTPISFSVEENRKPITRAGFTAATQIAMRIKSTKTVNNSSTSLYTKVTATAAAQETSTDYSTVTLTSDRYWDDAYGRDANLSVYAIAVPGMSSVTNNNVTLENKLTAGTGTWFTEAQENEKISWTVSKTQNSTTLVDEDLTYSNNISSSGTGGVYTYDFQSSAYKTTASSGCMKFTYQTANATDGPGKFDKGHLIFNHALSRISVNLIKGTGFGDNAFNLASNQVTLKSFPYKGTLNLTDGSWGTPSNSDITVSATKADNTYSLTAQVLPGFEINKTSTSSVLAFTIDGNVYNVTQEQMYKALENVSGLVSNNDTKITMSKGNNYVFNITVNKTSISVKATLVDFDEVTAASQSIINDPVTFEFTDQGSTEDKGFSLYRSLDSGNTSGQNWDGDYEKHGDTGLTQETDKTWKTAWYFGSNSTYYHFRTLKNVSSIVTKDDENKDVDDYFSITSGSTDYLWGAPMKSKPAYNTDNGYTSCLSSAIGPTSTAIAISELHIMSSIIVKLQTSNGTDAVTLNGSEVTITKCAKDGTVLMGSGKVTPSTTVTETISLTAGNSNDYTSYVVPQALSRGDGDENKVGLTIVTADGNKYTISDLSKIKDTATSPAAIATWLPGSKYTYTFTLTKTGVTFATCKVVDWKDVTAENTPITL